MKGNALIQKAQGISHGPVGCLGDVSDCLVLYLNAFRPGQFQQSVCNGFNGYSSEVVSLAPGQNRDRKLMHFRGRQYKNHIRWRLLQCFEQRIKGTYRKHMHLIDDINLILSFRRRVRNFFNNLTNVVHAVIGSRVNLYHIHAGSGRDSPAAATFAAGSVLGRVLTVYHAGKDLCHRCFAGTSGACKEIGMTLAIRLNLVLQSCNNMILSLHISKCCGTKFSV